jgi:hypothetical protein
MAESSKRVTISRSRFVQVPSEFLDLLVKNKEYAWVFMVLWDKAGASREAWISVAGLIDACKMNVHTIKAALKWLVDNGYVKRISRPGQVTHYELSLERRWAIDDEPESPIDTNGGEPGASKSPGAPSNLGLPEAPPTWGSQEPHEPKKAITSEPPLVPPGKRQRSKSPELPALPRYAEPHREALSAWWRSCQRKHPSKGAQLTSADLRGLEAANELGVLALFCEQAAQSTWRSLGFAGHIQLLQKLQRDQQFHSTAHKTQIKELSDEDFY